jgi:hypothetical protein
MGAYNDYINSIKGSLSGLVPFGGTLIPTSNEFPSIIAQQIKGGHFSLPTLEVLADLPVEILEKDMSIVVSEHERPGGSYHLRTRYYLRNMPPSVISGIPDYQIFNYWAFESTSSAENSGDVETQYAANFEGKRPNFLPSQISYEAYQAGYPNDATYIGGNPSDIIWVGGEYDPLLNQAWFRQRIGTQPWGIPVSISAGGDYEQNQYLDVIFKWITPKDSAAPIRPIQPDDYTELPEGWQSTPGVDYATDILTKDLYRSTALKNSYGILKSDWDLPILISSDPQLVRYGNTPSSTDFLNETFWRGYFTPGLDTFMATRPTGVSTNWTITKIDQESGEFDDFVFKAFSIGVTLVELQAAIPTLPIPFGGDAPNDCSDAPFTVEEDEVLYMSKATKHSDGSFKTSWSLWKRFDGLDNIQAVIEETPGSTFSKYRDDEGNIQDSFSTITLTPKLYKGPTELTTNISSYKWYRGATLIVFDPDTRFAINLGVELNPYHRIAVGLKNLEISPGGVDVSQQYRVGLTHVSRPTDYEDTIQLRDATDDGEAFVTDIATPNGSVFKNQTGEYNFIGKFFKGGVDDDTDVVFTWSIKDAAGAAITDGLKDEDGDPIGDTDIEAAEVFVHGEDIDQYATLHLTATFGEIVRTFIITLTDVQDAEAVEALYWGTGTTFPGSPTDFSPRTLTKTEVLALSIGYLEDAAGTWFVIYRIGGIWGGEIQMRSEAARPNGGISLTIFKNIQDGVDPVPAAPSVPGSGSIVPAGWTIAPTAFAGSEDLTYVTSCHFLLRIDVNADPTVFTRDNYTPLGTYGTPKKFSSNAAPPVAPGERGWSPVLSLEADGDRRVLKLIDWIDGEGTKPSGSGGVNSYIGVAGLTSISLAVDVRGSAGNDATTRPQAVVQSSIAGVPNISISGLQGLIMLKRIVVSNGFTEPRWFRTMAEVGFLEVGDPEIFSVRLFRVKNSPVVGAGPIIIWTAPSGVNLIDANTQKVDNDTGGIVQILGDGHKIRVSMMEIIPAGETWEYIVACRINSSGAGLRDGGYIESFGL